MATWQLLLAAAISLMSGLLTRYISKSPSFWKFLLATLGVFALTFFYLLIISGPIGSCAVHVDALEPDRTTVELGGLKTFVVSLKRGNPNDLVYDWSARMGTLTPGQNSNSPQAVYQAPDVLSEDTLTVRIRVPGCGEQGAVTLTAAVTVVNAMGSTSSPVVQAPTLAPIETNTPDLPAGAEIIGYSAQGYALTAWQVGDGSQSLILVGGIHGGYEWNTILLAYAMLDYFRANPAAMPPQLRLIIIPSANPDGQEWATGTAERFSAEIVPDNALPGRFNGNQVDLDRNWDCNWTAQARWRDQTVSGGDAPFSESESRALRDFVTHIQPRLVLFWHSAADGVYLSSCNGMAAPETPRLAGIYADAAGYALQSPFNEYLITGDASDYLSGMGIASFSVELSTPTKLDWEQNLAGVRALLIALSTSP